MSPSPVAAYSFLSFARQGLGVHVEDADPGQLRGTVPVSVTIRGKKKEGGDDQTETVSRDVELYGPGDVIGIDARAIIRTEPRQWITNFESNYLPFVEFYDEDFPWRYTPAAPSPDKKRLIPWLALVVLEESEFEDAEKFVTDDKQRNKRFPFIRVANAAEKFPPVGELWAWAHVHLNDTLGGAGINDPGPLASRLQQVVTGDRDRAYSRLLCPRTLKPNTPYHAFVIPTFETGRTAGLGQEPSAPSATAIAWSGAATEFPVYFRWRFRTGSVGDFEYLVRLLQPKAADVRVGNRDMDVQAPGAGLPGIAKPELGGILRLGGALRVPFETMKQADKQAFVKFDEWAKPFPQPFQQALAEFVNLPADLAADGSDDEDPLIAPPLYGRWHAGVQRLLDGPVDPVDDRERWLNELNLDPRYRVAAGFGTRVVQQNQESYMEAAWLQVGQVLAANRRIRLALVAMATGKVFTAKHLAPIAAASPEKFVQLSAPVQRRVLAQGLTVSHRMGESNLPVAALSKTMRQALRPRGQVARRLEFNAEMRLDNVLARIDSGVVVAAPEKKISDELPTIDEAVEAIRPKDLPDGLLVALRQRPFLAWLPLVVVIALALVVLILAPAAAASVAFAIVAIALAAAAIGLGVWLGRVLARDRAARSLLPENQTPRAIDALPASPDFRLSEPGAGAAPSFGATDSPDAIRLKAALRNAAVVDVAERAIPVKVRRPLDTKATAKTLAEALKPEKTIVPRTLAQVIIPTRIRDRLIEVFDEVMAYPEIDIPMYEPLKNISAELFLPNIHLIEPNSITLLETNQKFIEAYLVGVNHEFAAELLWREYPTDQRGSCFRQFWDVSGFLGDPTTAPEALREKLRDIPELHTWSLDSHLDDHDHREKGGAKEEELVLVLRGELLKKYPNAVIYAHRAKWQRTDADAIDKTQVRLLEDLSPAQEASPPRTLVKTPLYEAKVDPDITFFGFDLTAKTAKGGFVPERGTEEDPGWFFVIKERPGEPRFGLDIAKSAPQAVLHTWNELAWSDVMTPFEAGKPVPVGQRTVSLTSPGSDVPFEEQSQHAEDARFQWRVDTHAAELAYILYQVPVLMAVHAAEMLPDAEGA